MKNVLLASLFLILVFLVAACTENLDPLSPGSMDGAYAIGMKALVPLAIGNSWTYHASLFDTAGSLRTHYSYTLNVRDTITADTGKIPLVPPRTDRRYLSRGALLWYLLDTEAGTTTCWQIDSVENLRMRTSDDSRFSEQVAFNFRAMIGDITLARYKNIDTVLWASGEKVITGADSVKTTLVSKGADTLRTTLGSAPYFHYRKIFSLSRHFTDYYFKPGFGLVCIEYYQQTPGGKIVRVRRDELTSYHFN